MSVDRQRELEQYESVAAVASEVFLTIDERSVIRSVNPAVEDIFGYHPDELRGEPLTVLMPDDLRDRHEESLQRYLDTGERHLDWEYIELPGVHKDGHEVPLAISFSEYEHEGDRFFTGIIRDNTDRKHLERELTDTIERLEEVNRRLEESNERLEQFAYAASHDLQEPLRMVSNYLGLLERRYDDDLDDEAEEFIDYAVDGAERMREMIEGLLTYSRIETVDEEFDAVDLDAVLDDVLDDLQFMIEESDAEIHRDPLPAVRGDGSQLREVFQNLLENAIEYSGDEPPRIHVSADRRSSAGDEWVVSVRDHGVGVDPDHTERVFEVFQRLHAPDEHAGIGMGLALCRRIVEHHGGEIWIESGVDGGTTVSFTLPPDEDD